MNLQKISLKLNELEYSLNISQSEGKKGKWYNEGFEEVEDSDLIVVWETKVKPLNDVQRQIFLMLTLTVVTFAVIGNIVVLYVNYWR